MCMMEFQLAADKLALKIGVRSEESQQIIEFDLGSNVPCVLHWGLRGLGDGWKRPPESMWPEGTHPADSMSVDTAFKKTYAGQSRVMIRLPMPLKSRGLAFVLHFPETKRWVKDGPKDYFLQLRPDGAAPELSEIAEVIEEAEVQSPYWSLMHRFNLCHDLLH